MQQSIMTKAENGIIRQTTLWEYTFYNSKGEKEVIKNQSAYYKVVETNRDEMTNGMMFSELQTISAAV